MERGLLRKIGENSLTLTPAIARQKSTKKKLWLPKTDISRKSLSNGRASDPPWFNRRIRKLIKQKRGVYRREGRSPKWRRMKTVLESLLEKRRTNYADSRKDALLASDGE